MAWECAECHVREDASNKIDAVCHHCGKLLCYEDRRLTADAAFASTSGDSGQVAVHCQACLDQYHVRTISISSGD
jgi:hypothetical protein